MSGDDAHDDDAEVTDLRPLGEHRFDLLRAQLDAARDEDDGSESGRQAHVDAVCTMIVALVEELDEDAADAELAGLEPLVAHDARLEIATRQRLAAELAEVGEVGRAVTQLRAALVRARGTELEAAVTAAFADALRAQARVVAPATPLPPAPSSMTPAIAARLALEQAAAASGEEAERHARAAVEHARGAGEVALLHVASVALAEKLAARDALAEAEALLEELPAVDGPEQLETRALLEEVWRRLGSHLEDEPDEPDEPGEMDRQLRTYITKPRNIAQALVDGALASPDRIREWSHGELRAVEELESQRVFGPVRSFWCACGRYRGRAYAGIVCRRCGVELIHAASRRMRAGHITLAVPVVHPWYAAAAGQLLGKTAAEVEAVAVEEMRGALDAIDLEWLADDLKREIVTAPKAKIADQAGRRLAVVEAFRAARAVAYTRPAHVILDIVPVVPPHGALGCDRASVRAAYARLLEASPDDTSAAVRGLFAAFAAPAA